MNETLNAQESISSDIQNFIPLAMGGIFAYNMITKYTKLIPFAVIGFIFWKNNKENII